MSITVWSGLLFQWPVGLLSDRLNRLTVLSAIGFLAMLVSISIAMFGTSGLGVLLFLTAGFGVVFTIYPVAMARAQDNINKEDTMMRRHGNCEFAIPTYNFKLAPEVYLTVINTQCYLN